MTVLFGQRAQHVAVCPMLVPFSSLANDLPEAVRGKRLCNDGWTNMRCALPLTAQLSPQRRKLQTRWQSSENPHSNRPTLGLPVSSLPHC